VGIQVRIKIKTQAQCEEVFFKHCSKILKYM